MILLKRVMTSRDLKRVVVRDHWVTFFRPPSSHQHHLKPSDMATKTRPVVAKSPPTLDLDLLLTGDRMKSKKAPQRLSDSWILLSRFDQRPNPVPI